MSETRNQNILLGVSDPEHFESALNFAVEEATRRNCGITIVHVLSESLPPPPDPMIPLASDAEGSHQLVDRSLQRKAQELVTEVARRAREMLKGELEVDTQIPIGRRIHTIIEAAEDASLIVLEHRDLPAFERIFVHSTSVRVSARAGCPVVTVPHAWTSQVHHNRITVGIDDIDASADILRVACDSARQRKAKVSVVHAWQFMGAESEAFAPQDLVAEWKERSTQSMQEALAPLRRDFPDVEVESQFFQQHAAEALLTCSQESDLLILGRNRSRLPLPLPLGSVARRMVKSAQCPVEIVPPHFKLPQTDGAGPPVVESAI